jgi:hypothetical protein
VEAIDPKREARHKILLGLNMYGFDYTSQGGGHILGRDLIQVKKYRIFCIKRTGSRDRILNF